MQGDAVHDGEEILAVGESTSEFGADVKDAIQAVAQDKTGKSLTPRGGFKWTHDDASIATVALRDKNVKAPATKSTAHAVITGQRGEPWSRYPAGEGTTWRPYKCQYRCFRVRLHLNQRYDYHSSQRYSDLHMGQRVTCWNRNSSSMDGWTFPG